MGRRHIANLLALGCQVDVLDPVAAAMDRVRADHPTVREFDWTAPCDALLIATPHDAHLEYVRFAVARGLPFFVEKPLGTVAQLPAWRDLAVQALPVHQVGYNLRVHPQFIALRAFLPNPTSGQFFLDCDARAWPGQSYGSMILECSHEIDLALACGAPATVHSVEGDEHALNVWLGPWYVSLRDRIDQYHRQWSLLRRGAEASVFFRAPDDLGVQMYRDEIADFLACAQQGRPTACSLSDGVAVLDVCAQVEAMMRVAA